MMIRKSIQAVLIGTMASALSFGGGKIAAPAVVPVVPVVPEVSPWPIYVGLGLLAAGVSRDCACGRGERLKDTTYGMVVRAGWDFNPYIGIEARYLKSSLEKDFSTVEHYGIFVKPQYHITDQTNVYALAGYGRTTATGCTSTGDLSKNGASFGVGFEYDFSKSSPEGTYSRAFDEQGDQEKGWGLWVDFQHLLNNEGLFNVKTNVVTAGVTYDF